jgi:hypothetical protein
MLPKQSDHSLVMLSAHLADKAAIVRQAAMEGFSGK